MKRAHTLDAAKELVSGPRHKDYGDALVNFQRIADGWSLILGCKVEPHQVALCQDWTKTSRLIHDPRKADSWIDKCGYSAIGSEVVADGD